MAARRRSSMTLEHFRPPTIHERLKSEAGMMAHSMAREHPLMKQLHKDMTRALVAAGKKALRSAGSRVRRTRSS